MFQHRAQERARPQGPPRCSPRSRSSPACAFLSGVFVFSDTIRGTFDKLFANAYENTDAFVRSSNEIEADFGDDSRDRSPTR